MGEKAIQLQGVHKSYGNVHALRGLDLVVEEGEVFGFLGPNGAGKTTTIRCMLDLIRPDAGTISVVGVNPQADPRMVKSQVGYLPGDLKLEGDFTPRGFFDYMRTLRGESDDWRTVEDLADRLDLALDKKISSLSQGNQQKVGLIQSLLGRPPLLMLDEPTLGLDPLIKQEVLNIIRETRQEGTTVFFSSHILSEVQAVADRVGIIRKGVLVEIAQTKALIDRALTRATIHFKSPAPNFAENDLENVQILRVNDDQKIYTLEITGDMEHFIKTLAGFPVRDLDIHRPSLEEVFLKYYQSEPEED
jgi:ABC-2 type transport system ATP-binding protein